MFLFRKNIILVPIDYDGISLTKGILSFDCYSDITKCSLKCYNLNANSNLTLGVAINKELFKIPLSVREANNFVFEIRRNIKNTDAISVVLLNINADKYDIILWGSTEINNSWKSTLEFMLEKEVKQNIKKDDLQNYNQELTEKEEQYQFDKTNLKNNFEEDCNRCVSKQEQDNKQNINLQGRQDINILANDNLEEFVDNVIEFTEEEYNKVDETKKESKNFYDRISLQVEKMFKTNPQEKILAEIIPNSKFCKVEFDDKSGYYVFGVIYDNNKPEYLCYGVPSQKDGKPPQELCDYYQWLPLDIENDCSDGFYMMYQDATTGKNISVDII